MRFIKRHAEIIYVLVVIMCLAAIVRFVPSRANAYAPETTRKPPEVPATYVGQVYNATDAWMLDIPEVTYLGNYYATGYNPMSGVQCGKSQDSPYLGIGASGKKIIPGKHVAMYKLSFGTRIYIDGLGAFEVQDRGVGPGCVDVACETNAECYEVTGRYDIYIVQ